MTKGLSFLDNKKILILDAEGDGLDPTVIWCVCTHDYREGTRQTFIRGEDLDDLPAFLDQYDYIVGHNLIGYDRPAFEKVLGFRIPLRKIVDTLVLSKISYPDRKVIKPDGKTISGHSVEAWGITFGVHKPEHEDWSQFSEEMLHRCREDVRINLLIFERVLKELKEFSDQSILMEHRVYEEIRKQRNNGFYFNLKDAMILKAELQEKADRIYHEIEKDFPPAPVAIKAIEPKYKKDGSLSIVGLKKLVTDLEEAEKVIGGPFTLVEYRPFNLNSPGQVVERMNKAGWNPVERTDGAAKAIQNYKWKRITKEELNKATRLGWKVSEKNLETLPDDAPESAHKIKEWKILDSRIADLTEWVEASLKYKDSRIHGYVDSLGAATHRMTHDSPNTANITSNNKPYGYEMRALWTVEDPERYCLVGTDADQLEWRMLGHYMDDKDFTEAVLTGSKEDGTDVHSLHAKLVAEALGKPFSRDDAKTLIYAFTFGGQDTRIGSIVGEGKEKGAEIREILFERYPGLAETIEWVQKQAKATKMVKAIDGRYLHVRRTYAALNTLLQGGGGIACKYWLILLMNCVKKYNFDAKLVGSIHDEYQFEVSRKHAEDFMEATQPLIGRVGEMLNMKVPLASSATQGDHWGMTH